MPQIKKTTGVITEVKDLSESAREYIITPAEPFPFIAGAFVNVFVDNDGEKIRRAFSMSSSDTEDNKFSLTIRHSLKGYLTPLLWNKDFTGETVELMGPLGLNTADKMTKSQAFLFGFGVGAGVVRSLAQHLASRPDLESLTIVTGNRSIPEILHKDDFDHLSASNPKITVKYVVSDKEQNEYPIGYIQDHVDEYSFNNADIYMCGQTVACDALQEKIKSTTPQNCEFFVEDFH